MENETKQNLHEGHRKRLREKFMAGKQSFKEHDLLELLLGYSIARKDTNELAHTLTAYLMPTLLYLLLLTGLGKRPHAFYRS